MKWAPFISGRCASVAEKRTVPCVSLEEVIRDWLGGQQIKNIKIDAQGFDLQVVKSAGAMMDRIESVKLEVQCDNVATIYEGQPNCTSTYTEMVRLGFTAKEFRPKTCFSFRETDIFFTRQPAEKLAVSSPSLNSMPNPGIFARVQVAQLPLF